ncbi:MAG: hypothetical protein KKC85_08275, partial [Gammaproteobacteria bacterium]|nr:hypothetical protein [Gammaproteobacteria bacterium]
MPKEEPSRLLSKVAKFVRNPLKDWSELDAEDASTLENGYSREMLKDMIERRQRNDFVRRREFDMLRKLRQREAAGDRDGSGTPSSLNISSTLGKTAGRALTLKKIDEIEEQMSQQWWKGKGSRPDPAASGEIQAANASGPLQSPRAYADTEPGAAPPSAADAASPARAVYDGSIEEAAIRFAHGDHSGAEAILLQTLAPEGAGSGHDETWRSLFDLYRAIGEKDKFDTASMRYAQQMK